ncbi:chemotaxis protein CheC [Alkalimonas collagenimarina]|uniref:Chemotaxis protein CheC n=1 Tax=Alkalimonas collagenimarina TaxID=400390 RepID=A0ABT9H1S1_9GAMM|nr:chemotaxis protein CheC [Alkalimonas collagenimarina]MDP4537260.1 chemotaxis protein CheC [Alkalimonas collagenimarina]
MVILTPDQQDALQELMNVAMGGASDQLARFLNTFIHLQVPAIQVVEASSVPEQLARMYVDDDTRLVSQGFMGSAGIQGEAMLLYKMASTHQLAGILGYQQDDTSESEMLSDISSILTTTFLNSLSAQLDSSLSYSAPRLLSCQPSELKQRLKELSERWTAALQVNIHYQVTDYAFDCEMILLIPGSALETLQHQLDLILQEF